MEFGPYVDNIINKLNDHGCYYEIGEDEVRNSIQKYLKKEYRERIDMASFDFEVRDSQGHTQDLERLKDTFNGIKNEMISIVRELARTEL
jgi:CRISPR/Cas system-associated endoribonuclease Cas2